MIGTTVCSFFYVLDSTKKSRSTNPQRRHTLSDLRIAAMCDSLTTSRRTGKIKSWKAIKYDHLMHGDELQGVILRAGESSKPMKMVREKMLAELQKPEGQRPRTAKEVYDMIKQQMSDLDPNIFDDPSTPPKFCFLVCGFFRKEPFIFIAGHNVLKLDSNFELVSFTCAGSGGKYAKKVFELATESPMVEMVDVGPFSVPKFSSKDEVVLWSKKMMTVASIYDPLRTGGTLNLFQLSSNTAMSKDTILLDSLVEGNPNVDHIIRGVWREPRDEDVKRWEALDTYRP